MNIDSLTKQGYKKLFVIIMIQLFTYQISNAGNLQPQPANKSAQQSSEHITGLVTDNAGNPLAGVIIQIKGSTTGAITDVNGGYQIQSTKKGQTLVFRFVGMKQKEVSVDDQSVINVSLDEESTLLMEVVAVGYGNQKKKDITGAVSSVKSDNFNHGVASSPEQLIQGKVAGVNVTSSSGAPGSGQRIIIRGQGSIRENTGPLYVIDGFPVGLAGTGSDDYNPLNNINSEDIESIDVLKDASATAIYGARGANGVILITTKSGKAGTTQLAVSSKFGISTMANKIDVFSADEFRQKITAINGKLTDGGGSTDWQDELTRTAITQDHNLSLQGGTTNFNYRASAGYLKQEGIILNTGLERYSGSFKANQKLVNGKLNISYNLTASVEKSENANSSTLVANMLTFNPTYSARDANGNATKYTDLTNPLITAELYKTFGEGRKINANISPSFEIMKGLVYKLNFGYENSSKEQDIQAMPNADPYEEGSLTQKFWNGHNTLIENYLTYTLDKGPHNLTFLAGHSYQNTFDRYRSWSITGFANNGIEPRYNPGLGQKLTLVSNQPSGSAQTDELQSFFGRANYSYLGKYLLTATVRADGSSKFGANHRYGTFPSFAAGWRISEEDFMKSVPTISNLKLRLGWGKTGNQEIPSKITQSSYTTSITGTTSYPLDNTTNYVAGTTYVRLANPDIQWEVSTQSNAGLDFGLFGGQLTGTVDYFHKVSSNILLQVATADPIQPASTYWTNVKDMTITNKGLELSLDYQHKKVNGFSYGLGGNISFVDNVVKNSPYTILTTGAAQGSGQTGATINGLVNGYSVGSFYMKTFTGIGSDGLSTYANNGESSVVGSALPNMTYSFYLNLSYKRFDLSANFNGVSGNKIFNHTAMSAFYKAQLANSNNTTSKAVEYANESILNSASVSTRYLEDGAYLRLNNLSLGYNFNTKSLGVGNWIKDLRLSLTGQNLFVITKYSGYDPEVNQNSSIDGIQSFGIDYYGYPKARTFVVGLNFTLN
jgi:TonB-dependent starch-binding outer membrane protein SusC